MDGRPVFYKQGLEGVAGKTSGVTLFGGGSSAKGEVMRVIEDRVNEDIIPILRSYKNPPKKYTLEA